jgi:hypothetical protein
MQWWLEGRCLVTDGVLLMHLLANTASCSEIVTMFMVASPQIDWRTMDWAVVAWQAQGSRRRDV